MLPCWESILVTASTAVKNTNLGTRQILVQTPGLAAYYLCDSGQGIKLF